jgi:hypothetical protein
MLQTTKRGKQMKITVDLNQLTPELAYELGKLVTAQIAEVTNTTPNAVTIQATPKRRKSKEVKSKRFIELSKFPEWFIDYVVKLKKDEQKTLQEIANILNAQGRKTISGKPFTEQTVWSVVYCRQAKKAWLA